MLSLHSHYLGGERKGKAPVLVGRAPSRSLCGCLGLQGEAQKKKKKKAGERHWIVFRVLHTLAHMSWTTVFPPGSLGERLTAANPFSLKASLEGCTSLMVSNKQGTWCLCHFGKILLPFHGTDLQTKCEKTANVGSSLKQLEKGSGKVLEEMFVLFTLFKWKFPDLQIHKNT